MRGSSPSRIAARAAAITSIARASPRSVNASACARRRSGSAAVTVNASTTSPAVRITSSWRRWASRSRANWADVPARAREPLADLERRPAVIVGDRVGGGEDQLGLCDAEHGEHVVGLDRLAAVGDKLVEGAERVAEAAGGRAGDRGDGAVGDLDLLGVGDPAHDLGELLEASAAGSRSAGSGRRSSPSPCAARSWPARRRCSGGGSSSVFRNAFHASRVSMCASSRM